MLLPALKSAKDQAQAIVCKNNLKQLGLAVTSYAGDFNDMMPNTQPNPPGYPIGCDGCYGWDLVYIYPGLNLDILFVVGTLNRDKASASLLFCPSIPDNMFGGKIYGVDSLNCIATGNWPGWYLPPGYWMRNKVNEVWPPYSYRLSGEGSSETAFLCEDYAMASPARIAQHERGWNVWFFDGHAEFCPLNCVSPVMTLGNWGAYFLNFDKAAKGENNF